MASTWSSVSRLSKSSERHVSPLCDPRRLLLFDRPSNSPCDPGVPCGRSSDRLLLPTLLLAILASPVVDRQTVFFFLLASSLQLVRSSFLVGHRPTFLRLLFAYPTPSMGCLVWLLLLGGRQLRFPVVCPVPLPDCSFIVFCCFSFFRLLQLLVRCSQL